MSVFPELGKSGGAPHAVAAPFMGGMILVRGCGTEGGGELRGCAITTLDKTEMEPINMLEFHCLVARINAEQDENKKKDAIHKFYSTLTTEQKRAIGTVPFMFPYQLDYTYETFQREFTKRTGLVFSRWYKGEDTDIRRISEVSEIYALQYMCMLYHH